MKKFYHIRSFTLLAIAIFFLFPFSKIKGQNILCADDSLCLDAGTYRGEIQWQISADNENYLNLPAADTSPVCIFYSSLGVHFVRAFIVEGTCDTIFTDSLRFYSNPPMNIGFEEDTLFITDCFGNINLNDSILGIPNLTFAGGTGLLHLVWSPDTFLSSDSVLNPVFTAPGEGDYIINATVTDSFGCSVTESIVVIVREQGSQVFNFSGNPAMFIVPLCVDSIYLQAWGGMGSPGHGNNPGAAGLGGIAEGYFLVSPGDTIFVNVGYSGTIPNGGYPDGGEGGSAGNNTNGKGGGGGGSSWVRFSSADTLVGIIDSLLAVAGGGGGGGGTGCDSIFYGGAGGAGGGGNGGNGQTSLIIGGAGGFGAIGQAGGIQGAGCPSFLGFNGMPGSGSIGGGGGEGETCCCSGTHTDPSGGGGGGGVLGGGGGGGGSAGTPACSGNDKGGGGGGAGGTSSAAGLLNGSTTNGVWNGSGRVTISW